MFNYKKYLGPSILFLSAILNLASWLIIFKKIPRSNFPVLISYNIFWGHNILGQWYLTFSEPLLGTIIFIINLFIIFSLNKADYFEFLKWATIVGTFIIEIFVLWNSWLVVLTNK
jgi:hypothetical protein